MMRKSAPDLRGPLRSVTVRAIAVPLAQRVETRVDALTALALHASGPNLQCWPLITTNRSLTRGSSRSEDQSWERTCGDIADKGLVPFGGQHAAGEVARHRGRIRACALAE